MDNQTDVEMRLQNIQKYWRYMIQLIYSLFTLQDFIFAFIIFINKTYINYNENI